MLRKLQFKFIAMMMILATVVLITAFSFVFVRTMTRLKATSTRAMEHVLANREEADFSYKSPFPPIPHNKTDDSDDNFSATTIFYFLVDENGQVLDYQGYNVSVTDANGFMTYFEDIIRKCLSSSQSSGLIASNDLRYMKEPAKGGIAIVFADRSLERETLSALFVTFIITFIICIVIFFIIAYCLSLWFIKPVKAAWKQQMMFIADASHELKTPLTTILANSGIVLSHPDETVESQKKWIGYIKDEAERMKELVEDMIFLARSDSGAQKSVHDRVLLSDVVFSSYLPFESVAFEKGKTIVSDIEPEIYVYGDSKKLHQLAVILIDNAVKYANEGGVISVKLVKRQNKVKLYIRNSTDTAIPPEKISHIFDRFYRIDPSRARDAGGYGLGLPIAKTIAKEHGAEIDVRSSVEKGTMFTVTFHSGK